MSDLELVLSQRRYSLIVSGVPKYKIDLSVSPGSGSTGMPNHVFVMTIGTSESGDTFARIATLADLDLVQTLRSVAVDRGHAEYRSSNVTVSFSDIDTAIAAVPVIKDRVNSLVGAWQRARLDFITDSDVTNLPLSTGSLSVQDTYKKAYTDAVDARKLAEADQVTAQDDYESALAEAEKQKEIRDVHCLYSEKLASLYGLTADESVPASPAYALSLAVNSLNQASDSLSRSTRVAPGKKGELNAGSTTTVIKVPSSYYVAGDDTLYPGNMLVVTFSDGHKEVRTIDIWNSVLGITVYAPFTESPAAGSKWEIRLLTDYMPVDDFGAAASAATKVQASLDSLISSGGFVNALSSLKSEAEASCSEYTSLYDSALASESTKLSALETSKAKKDAAQAAANKAASELLDVCPDADLEALSQ
jgi:hypothetical protein